MKYFRYKAFGIVFESELEMPELIAENTEIPTVFINYGFIPENLPNIDKTGVLFQASPNDFLLNVENIGSYRVQNGEKVTISPSNKSILTEFRIFLLGSVFGVLLFQKGFLPLHGSAIRTNKGAIIIAGESAVGKSSLAASLAKIGYPILSDDISAINFEMSGLPMVQAGLPYLKLWKDVLNYFHDSKSMKRVRPSLEKYIFPLENNFSFTPSRIHKLVFLTTNNSTNFIFEEITGAMKFDYLKAVVYRSRFIEGLGLKENTFQQLAKLANSTKTFEIQRPIKPLLINELTEFFERNIIFQ